MQLVPRRAAVALAAILLSSAALACSSSPAVTAGESTTTTVADPTTSSTGDPDADEALAESAVLDPDEVPGGPWSLIDTNAEDGSDVDFECPALAEGAAFFVEQTDNAPQATGPSLGDKRTRAVLQQDVMVLASVADAERVSDLFSDPLVADCLEDLFAAEALATADEGVSVAEISVDPSDVAYPDPATWAWEVALETTDGSKSQQIYAQYVVVRVGRGLTVIIIGGADPTTVADTEPIVAAATDKLTSTLDT